MMPTEKLLSGHRRFREKFESEHDVFLRLAEEGQNPKVLWIGCSDSRVVPELITGADPGELFDVRNIANIVPPAPTVVCATGSAIEYAVLHLEVSHIVVCGHTECGGIKALEAPPPAGTEPHLASWIELAQPARERVVARGVPAHDVYIETIKANVLLQCENLRTYPCVAERERSGALSIHPWLYDLYTGSILAFDDTTADWATVAQQSR
jgi:carbonic anhydrase